MSELQIGHGKPGPGRKPGVRSTKYITINSMLASIQEALGCSYQEALADLLADARDKYELEKDVELFPKMMLKLSDKFLEQARIMPEGESSELETLTDEELLEKRKQAVLDYIDEFGIPQK